MNLYCDILLTLSQVNGPGADPLYDYLRKETGDNYVYKPSRSPRPWVIFDPPGAVPEPWRPQSH